MKQLAIILTACGILASLAVAQAQELPKKKLIQYGWDYRYPDYIRENIREMEKKPFDGIIFRLEGCTRIFSSKPWDEESSQFQKTYDDCKNIEWSKFTDNFIILGSTSEIDWFDDSHWDAVRHNLKMVLKAAKAARVRGICFDPEAYPEGNWGSPWSYWTQTRAKEKFFEEYEAKVRERGADFARILQEEMPELVLHTFYLFCLNETIADDPNPKRRQNRLIKHPYGLYQAFLNGILDAARSGFTVTDGNEYSYYYREPGEFYKGYHGIKQRFLPMVAPENRSKYQAQVQASNALYPDYIFALANFNGKRFSPAAGLNPEDRLRWFEQNVYYGLKTSDEFVWMYNENMNWWDGKNVPEKIEEAISRAQARILKGEALDFDISDKINEAAEKRKKEMQSSTVKRSADIAKTQEAKPEIDGNLDKPFWKEIEPLEPFILSASRETAREIASKAETVAKVAYDDQNLYLAIRCHEPDVKKIKAVDSPIWVGDSVDLFLSLGKDRQSFVHLIVNPNNVQWSQIGKHQEEGNERHISWKSATKIADGEWTVEMAVPWKELQNGMPTHSEARFANVCRHRAQGGQLSSWSQVVSLFHEPEAFGTWTFR